MTTEAEPHGGEEEVEAPAGTGAGEEAAPPSPAAGGTDGAGNGAPEDTADTASGEAAGAEADEGTAHGPRPAGDTADEGSRAEPEAKPNAERRRFNENMEQLLEGMDGLLQELARTGSKLDSLRLPEAKPAEAGNASPAAEPAPAEDAAPEAGDASDADGGTGQMADFYRWIEKDRGRRRRWSLAALAAAAPVALLLGVLVQHQFQPIPLHDPSGGWSGWIWETHGRAIVDCAVDAMRTNVEVDCPLVVRRP